jgi:hypothetical protein
MQCKFLNGLLNVQSMREEKKKKRGRRDRETGRGDGVSERKR